MSRSRSRSRDRGISSSSGEIVSIASSIGSSIEECDNFEDLIQIGNLASFSKKVEYNSQYTNFFGFKFLTKNLQEKNKNPLVVLWGISTSLLVFVCVSCFTYIYGTNFNLVYCISQPILGVTHILLTYNALNMSFSELQNRPILDQILCAIIYILTPSQDLYGFIRVTPFQNQSLFLLCLFFIILFANFYINMLVTKNETSWDEKNYQLIFFVNQFMFACINTIAVIDVFSDVVLGIDNILKFKLIYLLFGVFLVLFGVIDMIVLATRISYPNWYTLKRQTQGIILELLILGLSVANVFVDMHFKKQDTDSKNDIFEVGLISIVSTLINLIHHIALIIIQKMSQNEIKVVQINQIKK